MKRQFLHEDHNRQDKTKTPNYKKALVAESFKKAHPDHIRDFKDILKHKELLTERYSSGHFIIGKKLCCLGMSLDEYVSQNKLAAEDSETVSAYEKHRKAAEKDFYAIQNAIRDGEANWNESNTHPSIEFSVKLSCDVVIPWRKSERDSFAKVLFKK